MFDQILSLDSTQIVESLGGQSQLVCVEVIGAYSDRNLPKWQWQAHLLDTRSVRFSPDGQQMVSSGDESVHVLDSMTETLISIIQVDFMD